MPNKPVDTDEVVDQVAVMQANGYMPALEMAKRIGVSRQTIGRWAESGEVTSEIVAHRRYVLISSVIEHIGPAQAQMFGLVELEEEEGNVEDSEDRKRRVSGTQGRRRGKRAANR